MSGSILTHPSPSSPPLAYNVATPSKFAMPVCISPALTCKSATAFKLTTAPLFTSRSPCKSAVETMLMPRPFRVPTKASS